MFPSLPSTLPRIPVTVALLTLAAGALVACTQDIAPEPPAAPTTAQAAAPAGAELGVDTLPEAHGEQEQCPYLDSAWVENTNGQRVTGTGVDRRFQVPACVFWSYPEEPQLQVLVRHMGSTGDARAVVDWAAPVVGTEPAELPGGWVGGRGASSNAGGSVFAVQKDSVAVVVVTNQGQSFKAQQVAQAAVDNLGL